MAVFILVASLFLPSAVQPLSPMVCPANTELDNGRRLPANAPDDAKLELVCTSSTYSESAAKKVIAIVVGLIAIGVIAIWCSDRVIRTRVTAPQVPGRH
ncbi:MAG: hypothetical protein JWO77_3789 [Ilumatobacteraceae bacterium]|nr:hypothetical protein [Ilumatobacteraceae bacterium]